jgi:hypothetical protein
MRVSKIANAARGCKAGKQKMFYYQTYQTKLNKYSIKLVRIENTFIVRRMVKFFDLLR